MQPWVGFSVLTGVAASGTVWVLGKERGMQLQAFTFLPIKTSFQDLLALPVLNRNPNARTGVTVKSTIPVSSRHP